MRNVRTGAQGTSVVMQMPWGQYVSARLLCTDGVVRTTARISAVADTFFSVPCAVRVKGKTVAGYMTSHEDAYVFRAYTYRANWELLPQG